jgi:hypothetical protein
MEQPKDWKKTDDKPEWRKYHGNGKQRTGECMAAKEDITFSQGLSKPSTATNKLHRDNKLEAREAGQEQEKRSFRKVSFTLHILPSNDV